jgi:DNA-binding SARP family transcriptional activator
MAMLFEGAGRRDRLDPSAGALFLQAGELFHELHAGRLQRLSRDIESGIWPPGRAHLGADPGPLPASPATARCPVFELRCFGGLSASVDGQAIDLSAVKPRVRSLLRLLGAQVGAPVHREVICEALWPEADSATGLRNLQVAVSSLRRLLEPRVSRGGGALVVRDGDSYRLALPGTSTCDVVTYRSLLTRALELSTSDLVAAAGDFAAAASMLRDGLLPEEGPTDWAETLRERCRADASATGLQLAERALGAGDPASAAGICTDIVGVDRYLDPAWRLLILAKERSGDDAAARLTRRRYEEVLDELGVHGETEERPDRAFVAAR